jgi:hypothetical protein
MPASCPLPLHRPPLDRCRSRPFLDAALKLVAVIALEKPRVEIGYPRLWRYSRSDGAFGDQPSRRALTALTKLFDVIP